MKGVNIVIMLLSFVFNGNKQLQSKFHKSVLKDQIFKDFPYIYVYKHTHTHAYIHICIHAHILLHMHIYIYIYFNSYVQLLTIDIFRVLIKNLF